MIISNLQNKILKMDRLKQIAENRLQRIHTDFTRFLTDEIDWDDRMIGISGAREQVKPPCCFNT